MIGAAELVSSLETSLNVAVDSFKIPREMEWSAWSGTIDKVDNYHSIC